MIDFKSKIFIRSQNAISAEIASELSGNICAITRRNISSEIFEKNNAVLIDTTTDDMEETLESFILSGNRKSGTYLQFHSETLSDSY